MFLDSATAKDVRAKLPTLGVQEETLNRRDKREVPFAIVMLLASGAAALGHESL